MGEIETIDVADNAALQSAVWSAVERAHEVDPLAPVTLVVDSAAQAWALRRQVAERCAPGGGIANVQATTMLELLATLARRIGLSSPASTDALLEAAIVEARLRSDTGPLAVSADHPETALHLAALADELSWCTLTDAERADLAEVGVSPTARAAIDFAAEARQAVGAALGTSSWPATTAALCAALDDGSLSTADLGPLVVVCARVPAPVSDVLHALARRGDVTRIVVSPDSARLTGRVIDFPDPAAEADYAVRLAADALLAGISPGDVALLYSTDTPYARLLERALAAAGLTWHGPTGQTLQSTTVARCLAALTDLASARTDDTSGITRPLLMRLLGLGHLGDGPTPVAAGASRALIQQEGLFGDARNWLGHLDALALAHDTESVDPDDPAPRHINRLAPHAAPLARLVESLDGQLAAIVGAATWTELGTTLWSTLDSTHLQGRWWSTGAADAAAVEAVRSLLLEGFPRIDSLGPMAPQPSPQAAAEMIERTLASRRGRHGASSVGIHVGPVSSSRGLTFERVIIVGASEGLLPPVRGVDPLLPDAARVCLRRELDDLPRPVEQEALVSRDTRAVAKAAQDCVALLSRGGLPGRAIGLPSRYLRAGDPERVPSTPASLLLEPHPLAPSHLAERAALTESEPDAVLVPLIDSIAAWAAPEPGPYFGDLGPDQQVWSLHERAVSASAIEQFLHCPYHFFVERVLGFSTDEFADTVDTIAPNDMGSLLHTAFERFVQRARETGTLPEPGQPWPADALADLRALVDEEVAAATSKGLTGWRPSWERSYETVIDSLPGFLEVDSTQVRADPATTPVSAEQGFGFEGDPVVEFRVTDDVVVRLRGSIDRVDATADGGVVGIVDYKTNKAEGFAAKLGQPKNDGTPREREKVQDLVYDAAARVLYPAAEQIDVHFLFVPNGGEGPTVVTPVHDEDRAAVLRELLQRIETAGRSGAFLPRPQSGRDYCPVCKRLGRRARIVNGKVPREVEEESA